MYIKWLTLYFTDLCRSTCIYNVHPPHGPCPLPLTAQLHVSCGVMTRGENKSTATFHHHIKDVLVINTLLVYDNCYTISCHHLWWKNRAYFHTKGVLKCRCTKYHHPPSLMVRCMIPRAVCSSANGPTLDLTQFILWHNCNTNHSPNQISLASFTHELRNYL